MSAGNGSAKKPAAGKPAEAPAAEAPPAAPKEAGVELSKAMVAAKVADPEDTALLSEKQIKELNLAKPANLPKLDPSKDFYLVKKIGFMPSPECWSKIRLIHKISVTEGVSDIVEIDGHSYYRYQAKGYRLVGNDKVYDIGTKTINFQAKEAEKQLAMERKKKFGDFKSDREAEAWKQAEILRIRNFGMEMCETGAKNRLTRALTGYASGIKTDAEKALLVGEMEDVAQIAGGDRGVPTDKSKALSTMFFKAGEHKITSEALRGYIHAEYKIESASSLSVKDLKVITKNMADIAKKLTAKNGGKPNGAKA